MDPTSGDGQTVRILVFSFRQRLGLALTHGSGGAQDHMGASMVEEIQHLCLIERQVFGALPAEDISIKPPALRLQLLPCTEQVGVVRHVEHGIESNSPWVFLKLALADEHRYSGVNGLGQLCIASGSKNGTGTGVWIETCDVLGGQRESALRVAEVLDAMREADKLGGGWAWRGGRTAGEQAEFEAAVNAGENPLVFEIKNACERSLIHHVLKEELGGVVRGDAAGQDRASTAIAR